MSLAENLSHPLISALGWTLLHSLWQILVLALLWRSAMHFSRKAPASIRYHLSLGALSLIPAVSLFTFFRQYDIYKSASRIVSLEFETGLYAASNPGGSSFFLVPKNVPVFFSRLESVTPQLVWVYLAGLIILSLYTLGRYARLYSLKNRQIQSLPAEWQGRLKTLRDKLGLNKKVRVFQSPKVSVPMVVGMIRPVILLPLAMLSSLSTEQVESIFLHELYHLKRNDHYLNMLQNILEIVFFYHPATWWISRRLRAERENCVDEQVVKFTSSPLTYAQALMILEESRGSTLQPVLAATQSKSLLFIRIKNIMTMKTKTFNPGQKIAALLVILTAALSVAWINPALTINHGQPGIDFDPDATPLSIYAPPPGSPATIQPTEPPLTPVEPLEPLQALSQEEPRKIVLEDGSTIQWEELSEADREKIRKAMFEMQLAMEEVRREMQETFQSEEFKQQMERARQDILNSQQEVRKAMEEAHRETREYFESEEFRQDMERAREEMRKALEEAHKEMQQLNSEEFRQEMQKAREEMGKALEELRLELKEEGREPGDTIAILESEDWAAVELGMQKAMEEFGKAMNELGPTLQLTFDSLNLEGIFDEVFHSLEEALKKNPETNPEQK